MSVGPDRRTGRRSLSPAAAALVVVLCLALTASRSPSGRTPPPPPVRWTQTTVPIVVDGLTRSYLLVRPWPAGAARAARLPVLVNLHGCCVTPEYERQRSGFADVTGPAILVYPAGVGQSWNAGSCCGPAQAAAVDDVAFLTAVVDNVLDTQPDAASGRVFLAGYSNGGKMALRMACAAPRRFAAVASYAAVSAAPCPNPAPASLLEIAATGDPELTIRSSGTSHTLNGYTQPTVDAQVDQYRRANRCPGTPITRTQGSLTTSTWVRCGTGQCVQLAVYQGGSHDWLQGDDATPSATQVIWDFFSTVHSASAGCRN
ncbi:PHB depolymerase family esterase [Dactylosporangium sp. AC04546]|uniref:alpha/beta hydrolase family esterase n=1 Tax=Dactylosporangium sp. AC04546 TaxID=2862460 RepID=UPI001EE076A7|nr:PHB depolymerase family esterase [Dactylosporangium sp. AC04546]WVK83343.1 PHB depolymerase family esterase [Dactylosporangium sp. AC04546]